MDQVTGLLPFLIPVAVVELTLMIVALVDVFRRKSTRGPKWVWAVICVVFGYLGPIVYFIFGRGE